jgi:Family of unknown function (DUF6516)
MMTKNNKKSLKLKTIVDENTKLPDKQGNGVLRIVVKMDQKGEVIRYSMAYINWRICNDDNGRVLGYDNSHGYHHRHYMGREEPVEFESYEAIVERFEKEWRILHEQAKN